MTADLVQASGEHREPPYSSRPMPRPLAPLPREHPRRHAPRRPRHTGHHVRAPPSASAATPECRVASRCRAPRRGVPTPARVASEARAATFGGERRGPVAEAASRPAVRLGPQRLPASRPDSTHGTRTGMPRVTAAPARQAGCVAGASGACSRMTWALVPLMPNEDTPARRGRPARGPRHRLGQQPHRPGRPVHVRRRLVDVQRPRQQPVPQRHAPS